MNKKQKILRSVAAVGGALSAANIADIGPQIVEAWPYIQEMLVSGVALWALFSRSPRDRRD